MLTIKIQGADDAASALRQFSDDIRKRVVGLAAQVAYDSAVDSADSHSKTGAMAGAVFNEPVSGNPFARRVGVDLSAAPHALFVHWGTRPHVIKPKDRKALRWVSGDRFVFAKWVNHPGYEGDPFMLDAVGDVFKKFDSIVSKL